MKIVVSMKRSVFAIAVITLVAATALRAADNKALEALQKIGEEYKDFKAADASAANVRPEFSLRVVGGLRYFTKYSGGKVGAVKLSEQEAQKSKTLLEKYVTQTLQTKTNANSPWQLLVKCNQSTGAKMGGGAVWRGIPSVESDEDMNNGDGISLGFGGSVQPLVTGSLFLLNTKEKLLVFQKDVYAAGSDMDSALHGFAEAIDSEYLAWSKTKQKGQQPSRPAVSQQPESAASRERAEASAPVVSTRDMVLLYEGNQNPGTGWELKSTSFGTKAWECHLTVKLDVSKADGRKGYSLSLSQLGMLPGRVYIGPVHAGSGIERGATIANKPTSSGAMIMLLLEPTQTVLRWQEP